MVELDKLALALRKQPDAAGTREPREGCMMSKSCYLPANSSTTDGSCTDVRLEPADSSTASDTAMAEREHSLEEPPESLSGDNLLHSALLVPLELTDSWAVARI